jgi:hypothetical protein
VTLKTNIGGSSAFRVLKRDAPYFYQGATRKDQISLSSISGFLGGGRSLYREIFRYPEIFGHIFVLFVGSISQGSDRDKQSRCIESNDKGGNSGYRGGNSRERITVIVQNGQDAFDVKADP